ncbi:MAG: KilA-N domain-containing protein [Bacteroidetes bacterium]|nr:MAG: KilA-N domain-containing protein [Bacteroidota bacterium]
MAKKHKSIEVDGTAITLITLGDQDDYISLTDIMKRFDDEFAIYSWMRNKNTVEFLGVWEQLHNPNFKGNEFVRFRNEAGTNRFNLTPRKWIEATGATGIVAKAGRYGGTYAHQDIAVHFCSWLSPTFQLYLIKEFQRLKEAEAKQKNLPWNYQRFLSKVNYRLHTDTIRDHILPRLQAQAGRNTPEWLVYAEEADLLNMAVFGLTARQWRAENPELAKKGNMRDFASLLELNILANLQSLNAVLIERGVPKDRRYDILADTAISQYRRLSEQGDLLQLEE